MKNCIYKIVFLFFLITSKSFALVSVDITRGNLDPLPVAISNFYFDVNIDNNLKKTNIENKIPELVLHNFDCFDDSSTIAYTYHVDAILQ